MNGQQVAHYDESTTVDVLSQVTAFSNSNGTGDYVVQEGDTLKSIAQAVYGNASLWYVVAQANALNGDSDLAVGLSLSIPADEKGMASVRLPVLRCILGEQYGGDLGTDPLFAEVLASVDRDIRERPELDAVFRRAIASLVTGRSTAP